MWLIGLAVIFTLDLLATPLAAEAQSAGKVQRIGYLSLHRAEGDKTWVAAFRQGLRELGYVEDQNVVIEKLVRQASRPTLARLLASARAQFPPRGYPTTRPGTWLKHEIPIRTFPEWDDARPGFCEVDLVAHCGSSTQGFYLCTLCAVDIATTWVELEAVWGKGQQRVGSAVHYVRERLPVPLVGLDRDNGSEFINHRLYTWFQREGITFKRSAK